MPSASSAEVVEAALGLGSFAGTVKERRRPAFETVSAFSGVEGAVEEDMMDEGGWKSRLMLAHRQALERVSRGSTQGTSGLKIINIDRAGFNLV
jgi:hypothetical protein